MSASARAWLLVALVAGCGDHQIDLSLALASDSCSVLVPAGGSIRYQVSAGAGTADNFSCSSCLPVATALADSAAIAAFLRANAPSCNGVHPSTVLRIGLTAYSVAQCPDAMPAARVFCSQSAPLTLPDGRADALVSVVLTCDATCAMMCKPTTCLALGKDCDSVSDGCGGMLPCGSCSPPQTCGGHGSGGTPNVCSK